MAIRVMLADDHLIVRQGLSALLEQVGPDIVGQVLERTISLAATA